jgi:hypothetical protein
MPEPTITCPNCGAEFPLTKSLAAPLIEETRRDYEKRLADQEKGFAAREKALHDREADLAKAKGSLDKQIAERLREEHAGIAADEARKAKQLLAVDLEQKASQITELQEILKQR